MSEHEHLHPPQEPDAPSWKWLMIVTVGAIAISVGLSVFAVWQVGRYQDAFVGRIYPGVPPEQLWDRVVLDRDQLEFHLFEGYGPGEGQRIRDAERERLESWGWVDREAGTVHMPIDLAMELVAPAKDKP